MKTFTAKELNKSPAQVFRAADQDGSVKINHDRYPDKVFIIEGRSRGMVSMNEIKAASDIMDAQDVNPSNRIIDKVDGRYYTEDKE